MFPLALPKTSFEIILQASLNPTLPPINPLAKAKKEDTTTYIVHTIELPNGDRDSDDDVPF